MRVWKHQEIRSQLVMPLQADKTKRGDYASSMLRAITRIGYSKAKEHLMIHRYINTRRKNKLKHEREKADDDKYQQIQKSPTTGTTGQ